MLVRSVKSLFVAFVGLLGLLTGADNIIDYPTNFVVLRHVMAMDTTRPGNRLMARAITNTTLHQLAYSLIIGTELLFGAICIYGALRLFRARHLDATSFNSAKAPAALGLAIGFSLYFFGFLIIGGEWFQMWQSPQWNMQQPAFRFLVSIGMVLIFICLPDSD
ncbi:MAG: DUF2165 domain-containing protein [Methylovirgula sp.]